MRQRAFVLVMTRALTLLVAVALLLPAAADAAAPEGTTSTDMYFTSGDGTVLHADVIRKAGVPMTERQPVIMAIGPYFGHAGSDALSYDPQAQPPNYYYTELLEEGKWPQRGYTFVQVDVRGFGGSEGCNDFGGPGEQADVKAAVEWAASQPWSTGKVGMFGKSYDGWTLAMALATKPKGLGAIVIQAPIIDGYRALYMNGVHYAAGWYVTPALYQSQDLQPPSLNDDAAYIQHSALGLNPACYAQNIALQSALQDKDDALGFWKARDLVPAAAGSTVPTFWEHGLVDANAKPDNFLDLYTTLKGPKRVWAGQFPHDRPTYELVGRKGFYPEAMRWFDRYVKGETPAEVDPPAEIQDGGTSKWRAEDAWPPADAVAHGLTLQSGSVTDLPGNSGSGEGVLGVVPSSAGNGVWSISPKLPHDVHLAGTPRVTLKVSVPAPAHVFGLLYDIDAEGKAQILTRGAYAVKQSGEVAFDLYPQDWTFRAGHRIGFLLAGADDEWFNPVPSGQTVTVSGGALRLPSLTYVRDQFLPGRRTQYEETRPAAFAVDPAALDAPPARFDLPPALVPRPVPVAAAPAVRLTATLKRLDRRRVRVSGTAPAGSRVSVRLVAGRTIATRRVTARASGRWTVVVRTRRKVGAVVRAGGVTVRVTRRA